MMTDSCDDRRPRGFGVGGRPSLTLRIPRRGAPVHAYSAGLGTVVPCVTPAAPTPRERAESAPAHLSESDFSSVLMEDFSAGSRSSLSSMDDESDCASSFGSGGCLRRTQSGRMCRSGSGKALRVSFAEDLVVIHPTPVPEGHSVYGGGDTPKIPVSPFGIGFGTSKGPQPPPIRLGRVVPDDEYECRESRVPGSPAVKRRRAVELQSDEGSCQLEDSCDADVEDGFDASGSFDHDL